MIRDAAHPDLACLYLPGLQILECRVLAHLPSAVRDPFWEVSDLLMTWWSRTIGSNASHLISPTIHPRAEVGADTRAKCAISPVCHR